MGFGSIAKMLIGIGLIIILVGLAFLAMSKLGITRLPGDIVIKRGNWTVFFPITTAILISIILTIILNIIARR